MKFHFKKIGFVFFLISLLLFMSSCSDITNEALLSQMVYHNNEVNSYSLTIEGQTTILTDIRGQELGLSMDSDIETFIDRENKLFKSVGTIETGIGNQTVTSNVESYYVDEYFYNNVLNLWTKQKDNGNLFVGIDDYLEITGFVESGSIEIIDKSPDYYVVSVNPDLNLVVESILRQLQKDDLLDEEMIVGEVVRDFSIILYVNSDSFLIEKSVVNLKLLMSPSNMEFMGDQDNSSISVETSYTIYLNEIEPDFDVILPDGAKSAMDLDSFNLIANSDGISPKEDNIAIEPVFGDLE